MAVAAATPKQSGACASPASKSARCRLVATGWFPSGAHIGYMNANKAKETVPGQTRRDTSKKGAFGEIGVQIGESWRG